MSLVLLGQQVGLTAQYQWVPWILIYFFPIQTVERCSETDTHMSIRTHMVTYTLFLSLSPDGLFPAIFRPPHAHALLAWEQDMHIPFRHTGHGDPTQDPTGCPVFKGSKATLPRLGGLIFAGSIVGSVNMRRALSSHVSYSSSKLPQLPGGLKLDAPGSNKRRQFNRAFAPTIPPSDYVSKKMHRINQIWYIGYRLDSSINHATRPPKMAVSSGSKLVLSLSLSTSGSEAPKLDQVDGLENVCMTPTNARVQRSRFEDRQGWTAELSGPRATFLTLTKIIDAQLRKFSMLLQVPLPAQESQSGAVSRPRTWHSRLRSRRIICAGRLHSPH
ncbi:hypothetical protein D9758_013104 [Tetrapyrgos nigripes]|uniref:Uncharacterized protein n=1 Tax=Tetrapyrgos nigripes TaxID=182062 RepID=A0A8H5FIL1_9AGAR|nr:hypothetical protein D9758_013104 [Tetrapyrgos nigripes]